jgi:energy-coupling factor transport system ATP-binding protein
MSTGAVRLADFTWRPLGRKAPVVAGLDLAVEPGERVLLVGPSGAGKSTILHGLAGALGTTLAGELTGTAVVDGRLGLLLQNPADAIVAEHLGRDVAFGLENASVPRGEMWPRVDAALDRVGLGGYGRHHFTAALSGGEQQRLALAGVLVLEPDVLLLDEPTSMLDDATATSVREAILDAAGDRTMIVVEHRIGPWLEHVDRVVVLSSGGEVVSDGSVASFLAGPAPAGVWMPGLPTPEPLAVPADLVRPNRPLGVAATDVVVDLVTRTLRGTQRTRALDGFGAELDPGTATALTGPSGAGKSTALAVIGGLRKPTSGRVTPDLASRRTLELAPSVGWVPQNPEHGFLTLKVADEVARTAGRVERSVDVAAVLDVFSLGSLAEAHPYRLSGGEQRRLALAAALAHRPSVVLLDEPTVGQDPGTWAAVIGWIAAARDAGATVAVSTHDADLPRDVEHRLEAGVAR